MSSRQETPGAAATARGANNLLKVRKITSSARSAQGRIAFDRINAAARQQLTSLLSCWCPGGKVHGHEYVALNPTRADRHFGSFRINVVSGKWGDFATGERGSDPVSLFAFLNGLSQGRAAVELAQQLLVDPYKRGGRK